MKLLVIIKTLFLVKKKLKLPFLKKNFFNFTFIKNSKKIFLLQIIKF